MNGTKKTLPEMMAELERQKATRKDIVVGTDALVMGVDLGTKTIFMDVPNIDGTTEKHGLTDFAHRQIATKCGIPLVYYDRLKTEQRNDLLARNVNEFLPDREKRLIRILDNKVRAVLSDRYRIIDNYDTVFLVLEEMQKIKARGIEVNIEQCSLTEEHLYMKITSPDLSGKVFHFRGRPDEAVQGGIIISNSEVGSGAFRVEPFINVLVCSNGLIGEHKFAKVHLGKERGIGLIDWSDATLEYQDMTLWSEIRDLIVNTFSVDVFKQWLDKINLVASTEITKPSIAVDNIIKRYDIPKTARDDLINQFMRESPTQWGLAMAVTRIAQDQKDYERQVDFERIGTKILETPVEVLVKE